MELLIFLPIIAIFGYIIYISIKKQSEINNKKTDLNSGIRGLMKHIEGLPVPTNVVVEVYYGESGLTFVKDNQNISISKEQIISIDTSLGKDLGAGAVVGFLTLGLAGAVLGSTTLYMIVGYKNKEGEISSIVLDTMNSGPTAQKLERNFKKESKTLEPNNIEL